MLSLGQHADLKTMVHTGWLNITQLGSGRVSHEIQGCPILESE